MAALSSMTGFARISGSHDGCSWQWEARSVNGRGLDLRLRVPSGFEPVEIKTRKALSTAFTRGSFQISLSVKEAAGEAAFEINQPWLTRLQDIASGGISGMSDPAHLPHLLQIDGVVQPRKFAIDQDPMLEGLIMNSLDELIVLMTQARQSEGAALKTMLSTAVDEISGLTDEAAKLAGSQPAALKKAFEARFKLLLGQELEPERLATEAALLAMKADIREELDRLKAHAAQAAELLAKGSPVGRKLDFLAQEFNREINTLCSKSPSSELTQIGLDMKSVNEQFREQAANVE